MMRDFIETKKQYIDCFLFYRLGDFYELFFDDAEKASEIYKKFKLKCCGI